MTMFDALAAATFDEARTESNRQAALEAAESIKAYKVGELVLAHTAPDEAIALAEGFSAPYREYHRVYDIDPDTAYPAILAWIIEHHPRLNRLLAMNDQQLIDLREDGDAIARFVHRARNALARLLAISPLSFMLATVPYDEAVLLPVEDQRARDKALKAAQLILVEVLHQQVVDAANEVREPGTPRVNVPIQPHFIKRPNWRYAIPSEI